MESRRKGCCTLACVQPGTEQQMGFGKQTALAEDIVEPRASGDKRCRLCYRIKGTTGVGGFVQVEQTMLGAVLMGKCLQLL